MWLWGDGGGASTFYPPLQQELSHINSLLTSAKHAPSSRYPQRDNSECRMKISFTLQQIYSCAITECDGCSRDVMSITECLDVHPSLWQGVEWHGKCAGIWQAWGAQKGTWGLVAHVHHLQKFQCSLSRDIWRLSKGYEGYSGGVLSSAQTGCQTGYCMYCSNVLKTLLKRIKSALQKLSIM